VTVFIVTALVLAVAIFAGAVMPLIPEQRDTTAVRTPSTTEENTWESEPASS
jgi:hypothetical protein